MATEAACYVTCARVSVRRTARCWGFRLTTEDVEDLTQDALLRFYERRPDLWTGDNTGYLSQLASNLTIDEMRRRRAKKRTERLTVPLGFDHAAPAPSPEARLMALDALSTRLGRCRDIVGAEPFRVIALVYLFGLSSKEAGEHMGIAPSSVDTVIYRSREALARHGVALPRRGFRS